MIINQWSLKQEIAMMSLMFIKAFSWHFNHSIAMPGFPFLFKTNVVPCKILYGGFSFQIPESHS